jgi:uncharacterized ion transporter superfamily protein YfcC
MGGCMRILFMIIAILLMASYSYLHCEIIKAHVRKPKMPKQEYPQPKKKTSQPKKDEPKIYYEFVGDDKQELADGR